MQNSTFDNQNQLDSESKLMEYPMNNWNNPVQYTQGVQSVVPQVQNSIDPWLKMAMENQRRLNESYVRINEKLANEVNKADVSDAKKLHSLNVLLDRHGAVSVEQELFKGIRAVPLNITIADSTIYSQLGKKNEILYFKIIDSGFELFEIWVEMQKVDRINKIMLRAGICLGLSKKIEREVFEKLLLTVRKHAQKCEVPPKHGWNLLGEKYVYVFPDEMTWQEVVKNVDK